MTQEDKELLLKDLCSRLPYSVKVQIIEVSDFTNEYLSPKIKTADCLLLGKLSAVVKGYRKDEIKPYLFPLSSMTTKQKAELSMLVIGVADIFTSFLIEVEFYHKHHFDYRGLIPTGLAIDATGLNIY